MAVSMSENDGEHLKGCIEPKQDIAQHEESAAFV
jgi:hypothetical protein